MIKSRTSKRADLAHVRTVPLKARNCKVAVSDFARAGEKGERFSSFVDGMPAILAAKNMRSLVDAIVKAYRDGRMVVFMMGAHVIKCGLSPLVIDLMKRGVLKALALNGAGIIHDSEIAMIGRTSEDVGEGLRDGSFGMARETASFVNDTINDALKSGLGIGEALGARIVADKLPHRDMSLLASGQRYRVPVTAHIAIGTDIVHQHPSANGAAIGEGSLLDFKNFIYSVSKLDGGVAINIGSAVILPEVFLKALTVARNLGNTVEGFTAANFDMINQYRPHQNVLSRPTAKGGAAYNFIGHHEIMVPLLHRMIVERL